MTLLIYIQWCQKVCPLPDFLFLCMFVTLKRFTAPNTFKYESNINSQHKETENAVFKSTKKVYILLLIQKN